MGKEAKHVVRLKVEDREWLQSLLRKGGQSESLLKRARVLLKADQSQQGPGWSDERIAEFAEVGLSTVYRVRQRFVEDGAAAAVCRQRAEGRQYRKLDGEQESASDSVGVQPSAGGPEPLDTAPVGRPLGGLANRGRHQP